MVGDFCLRLHHGIKILNTCYKVSTQVNEQSDPRGEKGMGEYVITMQLYAKTLSLRANIKKSTLRALVAIFAARY